MNTEQEDSQPSRATQTRSIRLTTDVMARLQVVCDHLGVTVGSYMTAEIGRAVARDEVALQAKRTSDNGLEMLARVLQEATKDQEQ